MLARLVNVIYWGSCILAVLWLAFWLNAVRVNYPMVQTENVLAVAIAGAALIWLVGRATRYVLVGK